MKIVPVSILDDGRVVKRRCQSALTLRRVLLAANTSRSVSRLALYTPFHGPSSRFSVHTPWHEACLEFYTARQRVCLRGDRSTHLSPYRSARCEMRDAERCRPRYVVHYNLRFQLSQGTQNGKMGEGCYLLRGGSTHGIFQVWLQGFPVG